MRVSVLRAAKQKPAVAATARKPNTKKVSTDDSTDLLQDWQRLTDILVHREASAEPEMSATVHLFPNKDRAPTRKSFRVATRGDESKGQTSPKSRHPRGQRKKSPGSIDSVSTFLGKTGPIFSKDYSSPAVVPEVSVLDPFAKHSVELRKYRRQEAELDFLRGACMTVKRHLMRNADTLREVKRQQKDKRKTKTIKLREGSSASSDDDSNSSGGSGGGSSHSKDSGDGEKSSKSSASSDHRRPVSKQASAFMTGRRNQTTGDIHRSMNKTAGRLDLSTNLQSTKHSKHFQESRPMSTDRLSKRNFEETFKTFLSREFNNPLDPRKQLDDLLGFASDERVLDTGADDEDEEIDGKEEKKIIMEMYNKDNRDKHIRQGTIKTALTKHPRVPKASEARMTVEKFRKLPLLRNFKKTDEKTAPEKFYANDTREKIQEHKRYLLSLREKVAEYKANDTEPKFELYRRLADFYREQGLAKKAHIRISGLSPAGRAFKAVGSH